VLNSSAKRVLDKLARFVESGSAMVTGAATDLSGSGSSRFRRPPMSVSGAALGGGVPSAVRSDVRRETLASSASLATSGPAAPSSAVTALPGAGNGVGVVHADVPRDGCLYRSRYC